MTIPASIREQKNATMKKKGEITMETKKCCFCGKTINGFGNNPDPACTIPGAICCDKCNEKVVIPVRCYMAAHTMQRVNSADKND